MVKKQIIKSGKNLQLRSPIIAVLGHVDHGKTTLLDYIRQSNITGKEYGGITQKIGAYQVDLKGRKITFIDTPGHEAFEKIRGRGAQVADIVLLVVSADDSVKTQTVEAIKHIKKAQVPVIVAINKIDLPAANPERVKKDLVKEGITVEEFGGKIASINISAKTGKGIDDLLEAILLVSEIKKISADPEATMTGVVIESVKDKRKGNIATIIVKNGTLKSGDEIYVFGSITETTSLEKVKVRAMFDENGKIVKEAEPGKPIEVLGFDFLPIVGSIVSTDKKLPQDYLSEKKTVKEEEQTFSGKLLKVIVKADSFGSLEAVLDGLPKEAEIILSAVGEITENDIAFAKTTKAAILGFNLKVTPEISKLAQDEGVKLRTYNIIYRLFEEVADVVSFMKEGPQRQILGKAKIVQEYETSSGKIAGCQIIEGRMVKNDRILLVRREEVVAEARIKEIREKKEEVNKVEKGKLCGIRTTPQLDFFIGDMIQSYSIT